MIKSNITLEMYQHAIETLTSIYEEKLILKEIHLKNIYQTHIQLPETFEELLLTLKKDNELLDIQINLEKKKLANSIINSELNYHETIKIINIIIEDSELLKQLSNNNNWKKLITNIKKKKLITI